LRVVCGDSSFSHQITQQSGTKLTRVNTGLSYPEVDKFTLGTRTKHKCNARYPAVISLRHKDVRRGKTAAKMGRDPSRNAGIPVTGAPVLYHPASGGTQEPFGAPESVRC
jgi:hypothetical protein